MHCKSLWIKASAKCINVNVNVNHQSDNRRRVDNCVQQGLQQSLDHVDNLEGLEFCKSNTVAKAL